MATTRARGPSRCAGARIVVPLRQPTSSATHRFGEDRVRAFGPLAQRFIALRMSLPFTEDSACDASFTPQPEQRSDKLEDTST